MNIAAIVALLLVVAEPAQAGDPPASAHDFSFTSIDESETIALENYRGKVVVLVNTASFCGFTHQYSGLETLWRTYRDRGVVVLGVPSNDFGSQEPKSEAEIKTFCEGAFNVTFPLTKKYRVKGKDAHAFYKWVDTTTGGKGSPRWNFPQDYPRQRWAAGPLVRISGKADVDQDRRYH